ncbi:hypothetical protein PDE_07422 [Penicillium oxalicum 114-2]|uniref:Uncharacterized protein n=1 Tax=Penicillium oxalicum (strain 114-2 / CGMCC 5302) TaxID=933388 RepID=S8BC40_PENO1|nr:hypothetical protein PDE_07422 [Penicillium oxalicum 114-2]
METVNKVVGAATAAIWGEGSSSAQQQSTSHGDEPVSGVQGKGSPDDPYDAGNRDEQPGASISEANTAPQEPRLDGAQSDPLRKDLVEGTNAEGTNPTSTVLRAGLTSPVNMVPTANSPVPVEGAAVNLTASNPNQTSGPLLGSSEISPVPVEGGPMTSIPSNSANIPAPVDMTSSALQPMPVEGAAVSSKANIGSSDLSPVPVEGAATTALPSSSGQARTSEGTTHTAEPTKTEQRVSESTDLASGSPAQSSNPSKTIGHQDVSEEALKGPQSLAPVSEEKFEKEAENASAAQKEKEPSPDNKQAYNAADSADKSSPKTSSDHGKQGTLHKLKEKLHKVAHPHSGSH